MTSASQKPPIITTSAAAPIRRQEGRSIARHATSQKPADDERGDRARVQHTAIGVDAAPRGAGRHAADDRGKGGHGQHRAGAESGEVRHRRQLRGETPAPEGCRRGASCRRGRAARPSQTRRPAAACTCGRGRAGAREAPRLATSSSATPTMRSLTPRRVDGQELAKRDEQHPDGDDAGRVAEAPLQSGAPVRSAAIGGERRDRHKMIGPGDDVEEAGGESGQGAITTPRRKLSSRSRMPDTRTGIGNGSCRAHTLALDRLQLEELVQRERTELAADARLLVAAERRQLVEAAAVDVDLPGAQPARDLQRAFRRRRPHAARKAVDRVVGDAHGVVFACRKE